MARGACGGQVFILHRQNGNPWHLHSNRMLRVEPCSGGVRIVSPSLADGYSATALYAAMLHNL
jgi:hypothetical protein